MAIQELQIERALIPLVQLVVFARCWAQPLLANEALRAAAKWKLELHAFVFLESGLRFGIGTRTHGSRCYKQNMTKGS